MGQPRHFKHNLSTRAHPEKYFLGVEATLYSCLLWTRVRREKKDGGRCVKDDSPSQLEIPLPLPHTLPAENVLASAPTSVCVQVAANYNDAHQIISKGFSFKFFKKDATA